MGPTLPIIVSHVLVKLRNSLCATCRDQTCRVKLFMEVNELMLCSKMPGYYPNMENNSSNGKRLQSKLPSQGSDSIDSGQLGESVLVLVFESMKWDIHALCHVASSSRRLHAIAKRLLWRELCVFRAPRMVAALNSGGAQNRIGGGWPALAKLLFFCPGCEPTRHFQMGRPLPGHFLNESRFSKTSGRSFLSKKCKGDLLYVSDPCEHARGADRVDDLGIFRGVFWGFIKSKTRACLVARQVALEERLRCPYCGARVWSMTSARLVPKSAAKRLGSYGDKLEFFVCVNGHMFGSCWLIPLSSDDGEINGEDEVSGSDDDDDDGSGPSGYGGTNCNGFGFDDLKARNGLGVKVWKGFGNGPAA